MVVLHYTAMDSAEAALARLSDPAAEVSAHYLVAGDGRIWQLVPEARRAWHAGAGAWGGVADVNSRSIGVELDNRGDHPFAAAQMQALEALLDRVLARWAIPPARVIGHSDMAPGRKRDPGPRFDWARLARGCRAVRAEARAAPADAARFRIAAARIGYRAPGDDWDAVLAAFRLRFRPSAAGPLAGADVGLAEALAAAHPCIDSDLPGT
ncbi:MAG: N-acetylmuramoyl-L-alanine amidase [Pseudomonadota bacterium]